MPSSWSYGAAERFVAGANMAASSSSVYSLSSGLTLSFLLLLDALVAIVAVGVASGSGGARGGNLTHERVVAVEGPGTRGAKSAFWRAC
jgi:hypothetical protein